MSLKIIIFKLFFHEDALSAPARVNEATVCFCRYNLFIQNGNLTLQIQPRDIHNFYLTVSV